MLKSNEKKKNIINEIFQFLYLMLSSFNDETFNLSYEKSENYCLLNQLDEFLKYFQYYKDIHNHWNFQKREINQNIYSTNNLMELYIRSISMMLPGCKRTFKH